MTPRRMAKILGITLDFDLFEKKGKDFPLFQIKRKIRYYCFSMKTNFEKKNDNIKVPKQFIEYFEKLDDFETWKKFGITWDVKTKNPIEIYYRDFSVNQEWDATIRRVVPEFPVDRVRRQNGPKSNI